MVRVLVVADDFGISEARNHGIIRSLQEGVVTGVSLIVNGSAVEHAIHLAAQRGFLSVLGLHLNLSEGLPISAHSSSLSAGGLFLGKHGFRRAVFLKELNMEDVQTETQAQIDKFASLVGRRPSRVDGHQHCHVLPGVREAVAPVLARNGVHYTRMPNEHAPGALCEVCATTSGEANIAKSIYESHGIVSADCMVGLSFCASGYSPAELARSITTQVAAQQAASCEERVKKQQIQISVRSDFDAGDGAPRISGTQSWMGCVRLLSKPVSGT